MSHVQCAMLPQQSQEVALPLLDLLAPSTTATCSATRSVSIPLAFFHTHCGIDGQFEDFIDTLHLLAAALEVECAHSICDCLSLLWGDGRQALGLEEVDAGALRAEVGLEAN